MCQSKDPKDNRLRVSILIQAEGKNIVIDAGPDFRQQMLRARVTHLDAIILTHEHNDHMIGVDDVRPFNFKQKEGIPVYATERVQKDLLLRFRYVFSKKKYRFYNHQKYLSAGKRPHMDFRCAIFFQCFRAFRNSCSCRKDIIHETDRPALYRLLVRYLECILEVSTTLNTA